VFRFHAQRLALGLTLTDVWHATYIQRAHLILMEKGRLVPTQDELSRLSNVLGLPPSELMKPGRMDWLPEEQEQPMETTA
jgi:transcriptional regulator with XRE-family HTH domain